MLTMIPSVNADMIDHHHNKQPYDAGVLDYSDAGSIYGGIVYPDSNGMQSYEEDIYSSSPISQNLGSLPFVPDTNIELDPANSTFMYDGNHDDPSGQYHTLNVPSMPNDQYHQQQPPTMMTTAPVSVSHYQQQPPAEYSSWMNAASRGVHHHEQPGVMS